MLFRQFVDDDLGCASYLIGDESSGEAVVVDPAYAIEQYLEAAEHDEVRLVRVIETHTHADHVSGHGRLALEHGLPVSIHRAAEPEYPFDGFEDGDELEVGSVLIRVVHTPGHRPEHCALAVSDRERADEPWLTLTGDSLFVGDAARPDLAVEATEGAHDLYRSLQRLLELPDGVEVYPGHVAGSLCGSGMSSKRSTTIGFERRFNHKVTGNDEDGFVAASIRAGVKPPNMDRIVELNRGPFLGAPESIRPLNGGGAGAVLDVRSAGVFAAGHAKGALNVPVDGGGFATKAAFVLPAGERVVIHAASDGEAERAARGLRSVGILDLAGYVLGPPAQERLPSVEIGELDGIVGSGEYEILDVREPHERDEGYIPGSRNIPYRLVREWADDLEGGKPVITICSSGARAAVAASVLAAAGVEARPVLDGGVQDWAERGGDTVSFRRCGS
ncbi:MAG TPA: MBL fold metallo-hydrolase [Gaiellaceae bacterium]|jgi:glyoxylase-like metal-dependent hydrolase (beta-lactamase superfamily II)/rhodanese-related sulfurtransferase|nr:MBL fold metallo-hydrolase [Gaiellaceae bacterium]